MQIARFDRAGANERLGLVVDDDDIVDITETVPTGTDMVALLTMAHDDRRRLVDLAVVDAPRTALKDVRLRAPISRPPKFLAIGFNMPAHVAELDVDRSRPEMVRLEQIQAATAQGFPSPRFPIVFNKQTSCIVGPEDDIWLPKDSSLVDYEGEVAVVIGRRARRLSVDEALDAVAGYLVCNDVSVRDWQFDTPTVWLGKSFETHGPVGPWVTTADEVGDPSALEIRTWINGEERQRGSLTELITPIPDLVALLSQVCTLEAGDIITMGSPAGIGLIDGRFLQEGDRVQIEVPGLGALDNRVVREPAVERQLSEVP